ncbi:MAG: hypothetical protein E6I11_00530 [Chloroflexi bacterium]|nr:MAG: hypothetical protein E6I11_00530 [Chloroflexota bacterium]
MSVGLVGLFAILATLFVASPEPQPTERVLNVGWAHQAHNLSCEAAALKMALSYYGIDTDELRLISFMSRDSRPARFDTSGHLMRWGDPAAGFVGNPDGRIQRYTGYGVYYQPVALAAMLAGANVVEAGSGLYGSPVPPAHIYQAVLDGHPVVAWISNTYHQVDLAWYVAYDGATVRYTLTEHAVTIIGVRRDAVLINDPWFGRAWHPKEQFESAYRTFADMAIVLGAPNSSPLAGRYPA